MTGGPNTTKEAAMRLLLGEMGPLFDRAESLSNTLNQAHELIEKDLTEIGQLVTTLEASISNTMDQITYLQADLKRTKETPLSAQVSRKGHAGPAPVPAIGLKALVAAMLVCSVLGAALAVGVVMVFNQRTIEAARVGNAITKALPYIDQATKKKLEEAIQKAGS